MHNIRLTCLLPAPRSLSDYEPIKPLGPIGQFSYGCTAPLTLSEESYRKLLSRCRLSFAQGATLGVSTTRRLRAVFFDMDATVIAEESLVEISRAAGPAVEAEVELITERAMAGELEFKAALIARVSKLAGLDQSVLAAVSQRLTLNPGIVAFLTFCRDIGVKTYLISGGFVQLAEPLARQVGFDGFHANSFEITAGRLTGQLTGEIVDAAGKRAYLERICKQEGFDLQDVAAVGDGANDIPMLNAAGVAIGYKPKPILREHIHAQNAHGDHRFLAPLLFGRDLSLVRG